jgi:hypothetical protein
MKVQRDPVLFTCQSDELDEGTGQPPLLDEDGNSIPDNSMLEVFDGTLKTVASIWQYSEDTGEWYQYGV